jgi:Fe-S cluster assembly protein SufD
MSALLDSLRAEADAEAAAAPAGDAAAGLVALRRAALESVLADGLPGQRSERWKYTSLRALSTRRFSAAADSPRLHPATLADVPAPRLVFVNGELDAALSQLDELPPGLTVRSLSATLAAGDAAAQALFAGVDDAPDQAFTRLNTALARDGAIVHAAEGQAIERPLHLVFVGAPAAGDIASHARHAVVVGARAQLTLVEHHVATGAHRHLGNHVMRVQVGAGATLVHARLQDEDNGATLVARTEARVQAGALYHRVDLELGAGLSRHELEVALDGEQAQFISGGALLAGERRHVDTRLAVEHIARDTRCDLLWRGLAADRGRVAFHGGIAIQVGADGSDARLSNKNLLLSNEAEIDSQPVLQIHADEVKAAHGATIGRLDATSLFYLRSRGIPAAQARVLLTLAFCREALASIGDLGLIESLSPRLEARLAQLESAQ